MAASFSIQKKAVRQDRFRRSSSTDHILSHRGHDTADGNDRQETVSNHCLLFHKKRLKMSHNRLICNIWAIKSTEGF